MTEGAQGFFDLGEEIERFPPEDDASGRRAETLVKTDHLRVVLVTLRAGAALHEHTAPGPITIRTLRGWMAATYDGQERAIGPGQVLALAAGVRHAVRAIEAGAFLLTIGWSPEKRTGPAA